MTKDWPRNLGDLWARCAVDEPQKIFSKFPQNKKKYLDYIAKYLILMASPTGFEPVLSA